MNKKRMMQGIVGCRLREMDGSKDATIVKAEEIAPTNRDQIITAEEESRDERDAQMVWHNKEVD